MRHLGQSEMIFATAFGIDKKDKRLIIPYLLQKQILQQLQNNHMNIEKIDS